MTNQPFSPDSFQTFGELLKYLRRRERLTQLEFSILVGYSDAQITRLEKNLRRPDLTALKALFIPALGIQNEPELVARFLELAQSVRQEDAPLPGIAPYKGLLFFDEADAKLFFGRELLTEQLVRHVMYLAADVSTRFLAVVGASGSGKSSLMRAGLAVVLKRAGWDACVFTPTATPLRMLEMSLSAARTKGAERVLLLVDQFEEVFTLCRDEVEKIIFIEKLLSCAQDPSKKITIVIALRADFYSHCAQYPLLRQAVAAEQEYIGQMTIKELRRAIEEPARRHGWEFEPALVDVLLNDVGAQGANEPEPGALPLLSHALLATWEHRRGRTFTLDGYRASGGVRGAIAETAESVFNDQLNQTQQELARDVFLRLTELGEGTEDTRRRAALNELVRQSSEAAQLRAVLNTLAEARLITLNADSAEVAHEALIREWQRLHEWLTQDREGLLLHRHLTESTHEWEMRGRDPSELYRGARLAQAREWASIHGERLNAAEQAFLTASIEQEQHDVLEKEAQRQRELEAAQKLADTQSRAAKQLRRRAIFLAVAFVLAIALAGVAAFLGVQSNQNAFEAQQIAKYAKSRELAAAAISNLEEDPQRSILLALQAESTVHTIESENALHRSILASRVLLVLRDAAQGRSVGWSVNFSPDGRHIATATGDHTAKIWDAQTGELLMTLKGHTEAVNNIAYSPDGRRIATTSDDHTAKVWDATTGEELLTLSGHTDLVFRLGFSPDGRRLVTTSADRTAKVWDTFTGAELITFSGHEGPVFDVSFNRDGKRIATTGEDGFLKIWDATTGEELLGLPFETEQVIGGVAFSPDGTRVAATGAGDNPNWVHIWDAATGEVLLASNLGHSAPPADIAFSPDGRLAATGGGDQKANVWDVTTGQVLYTLSGHTFDIDGLAFSPDGTRLATASGFFGDFTIRVWDLTPAKEALFIPVANSATSDWWMELSYSRDGTRILADYTDGNARIWDATSGKEVLHWSPQNTHALNASYSSDGRLVATANEDNTITVWDGQTGQPRITLVGHKDFISQTSFSPDATRLASASFDGKIIIWDLTSGKALYKLTGPAPGFVPVAYSPDGKHLASGDFLGNVVIWDVATGESLFYLSGTVGRIQNIAYSPDGNYVAVASHTGAIGIWDANTGKKFLTLRGNNVRVAAITYSPDGKWIAAASPDGTARMWDAATGENLLSLPVDSGGTGGVAFSPDGKRLAVGGKSGIYVLVLPIDEVIALAKSRLTRSFTLQECQQYLHMEQCPSSP